MRTFMIISSFMISTSVFEAANKIMENEMFYTFIILMLLAIVFDGLNIKKNKK